MPEASVIISTYNRRAMLRRALASALGQRDVDLEVVVVDNGSTDGTAVDLAAIDDPRLRVVRNERSLGPTGGRNTGLLAASGTWIGFLDDDDLWAPDKLRRQLDALRASGRSWAYTGCVYIDGRDHIIGGEPPVSPDRVAAELPFTYVIPAGISGMLFHREALDGPLDPELVWATDWDLALRLLRATGAPAAVSEPLVAYRQHGANVSRLASTREHELAYVEAKFADLRGGRRIPRGPSYRFLGTEALRVGERRAAVGHFLRAALAGHLEALLRIPAAIVPRSLHGGLRRRLLSDGDWMRQARGWLDSAAPPRPRVLIVQNYIAHYRVSFYDRLRGELERRGIDLAVVHSTGERWDPGELPWAAEVPAYRLPLPGGHVKWQRVLAHAADADLVIVEQASRMLHNIALLLRLPGRVAFWGHGRNLHGDGMAVAEVVKAMLTRRAAWFFAYTPGTAAIAAQVGVPPERITVVQNASDTDALREAVASVTDEEVEQLRAELGLPAGPVFAYIGALKPGKDLRTVFAAADAIHARVGDAHFLVVGDGELRARVADEVARRPWATYAGKRFGRELAAIARLVDVVTVPVAAGLIVVDAFALGLPLAVSASAPQMPEVEYLEDGVNGLVVDDGGDVGRYADAVAAVLVDDDARTRVAAGARASAERYDVPTMARRFADGVEQALAATERGQRLR